jgi:hypothetical protein
MQQRAVQITASSVLEEYGSAYVKRMSRNADTNRVVDVTELVRAEHF